MRKGLVKNRILPFLAAVFCMMSLSACFEDEYAEYLGVYECIYITANGTNILDKYEYYRIELKENRVCATEFRMSVSPYTNGTTQSKFDIEGEKFIESVTSGGTTIKNEYQYVDGVIILEAETDGIKLVVKFQRAAVQTD